MDRSDPNSIDADYVLSEAIGKGGMGVVYRATQRAFNREVAIKVIKAEKSKHKRDRFVFMTEAVVTAELDHPNIVPVHDFGWFGDPDKFSSGDLFFAMKEVSGNPWDREIKTNGLNDNLDILLSVADAIAYAHGKGVAHCDIKPENVMLGEFGEILLMDWGLAVVNETLAKRKGITEGPNTGGTPAYMSPEQGTAAFSMFTPEMMRKLQLPEISLDEIKAAIALIGPPSDIYQLGACLFEVLTRKPPHTGRNPYECIWNAACNQIRSHSHSGELLDIALKAMATLPDDRYSSVVEFQRAVRDYLAHSESIELSNRAFDDLEDATNSGDYESYFRSIFAFERSLELWKENVDSKQNLSKVQLAFAETASRQGEYKIALSQLNRSNPDHLELVEVLENHLHKLERRARLRRTLKSMMVGAFFYAIIVGLPISLIALVQIDAISFGSAHFVFWVCASIAALAHYFTNDSNDEVPGTKGNDVPVTNNSICPNCRSMLSEAAIEFSRCTNCGLSLRAQDDDCSTGLQTLDEVDLTRLLETRTE